MTFSEIASPQQMHIRGLMLSAVSTTLHQETSPDNQGATLMLGWEKISEPARNAEIRLSQEKRLRFGVR